MEASPLKLLLTILSVITALFTIANYQLASYTIIFQSKQYRSNDLALLFQQQFHSLVNRAKMEQQCRRQLVDYAITRPSLQMRQFTYQSPVRVFVAGTKDDINMTSCAVPCLHHPGRLLHLRPNDEPADAVINMATSSDNKLRHLGFLTVYRTMEAAGSKIHNYDIAMTPSLRSDVPVPYFSWVIFNFMKPMSGKTSNKSLASALISNCDATVFRLKAIDQLQHLENFTIDFKGRCSKNYGKTEVKKSHILRKVLKQIFFPNKLPTLFFLICQQSKFHLAFENTQQEDYVTEKFFESLVEGSVPVVIGAPNIADFAPRPNSFLVIPALSDTEVVGRKMLELAANDSAYKAMLAWKATGPSDSFKALVDLSVVHSSCRLCIQVADVIRQEEECAYFEKKKRCSITNKKVSNDIIFEKILNNGSITEISKRRCSCTLDDDFELHLLRIRERGKFEFFNIFLRSNSMTIENLHRQILSTFTSISPPYKPIWMAERDQMGRQKFFDSNEKIMTKTQQTGASNTVDANETSKEVDFFKIYRIYPVGISQRTAVFEKALNVDSNRKLENFIKQVPCGRLEVIFV